MENENTLITNKATTGKDLQESNLTDTMQDETDTGQGAGRKDSPEDTQAAGDSYERVIAAQNATIETLTRQIESLNGQISSLVRSSGSKVEGNINPAIDSDTNKGRELPKDYTYLKDLGKSIGRRE